ncbi:MAG: MFS transporter [Patescibacteria group bacterium]
MPQIKSLTYKRALWQPLHILLFIILFLSIYEGIVSYIMPLLMLEAGFSKTTLGILISGGSVFGALFDFLLCKYIDNAHFRKMYLLMFAASAAIIAMLLGAKSVLVFIIIMAVWGLYYDLRNFGHWDFVARCEPPAERASSFGLLSAIKSAGAVIAPLIAGFLIGEVVGTSPLITAAVFLAVAALGYVVLLGMTKKTCHHKPLKQGRKVSFYQEIKKWNRLGHKILPVIGMTFLLGLIDAFFWSVGPIFAESLTELQNFRGLFLAAYYLPVVFVIWLIRPVVRRLGKKKSSLYAVILGLLVLSSLGLFTNVFAIILIVFISSSLFSIAWPANDGVYADFISESQSMEKEVKGMGDFSSNMGYIIGPIMAGLLMDAFGNGMAFTFLGLGGTFVAILLLLITPKSIAIPKK